MWLCGWHARARARRTLCARVCFCVVAWTRARARTRACARAHVRARACATASPGSLGLVCFVVSGAALLLGAPDCFRPPCCLHLAACTVPQSGATRVRGLYWNTDSFFPVLLLLLLLLLRLLCFLVRGRPPILAPRAS